ncbi:NAD(P)H-hydrate epimerase [Cyclobacterium lianum]|uniref:Bifunctional NAD(P)H-hydrate repair enzyme n=1 Tax=Cyclobacterium lianum TaxID=388280 RepID=A0A1M7NX88_9BACT|nr:bifunctional ADP-dependent NAD(P)H-hydrate dehydratase/NAD(P)H-hydrate epimerase [Cyclobacterium lianum]SHN08739.1 NAD(P)H-hydrate epimerase [Cyclobacterium lianum]
MQKILSGNQVKILDQQYVSGEGISSYQLMERAANAFCDWFVPQFDKDKNIAVYCGKGNNGGDGLAIARILALKGYAVAVGLSGDPETGSADFRQNLRVLPEVIPLSEWDQVQPADIVIDAVFGVGINRPLAGEYLALIRKLNDYTGIKISIDMPSGLPSDAPGEGEIFRADYTVSFQFPKIALLCPEHAAYSGKLVVRSIGISSAYFEAFESGQFFYSGEKLQEYHKTFHAFSHKGDFGRVMLAGGSYGKMGSICLSARAALRSGSGLVFCHVPGCGVEIMQTAVPEAMVMAGEVEKEVAGQLDTTGIDAIGIGPGLGKGEQACNLVYQVLSEYEGPTVLDADALNILVDHPEWLNLLHPKLILTPHVKEFERITGIACKNHFERIKLAGDFARKYGCVLVLKGAFTLVSLPDGKQIFNNSGSVYMATGGSGDVLTGMLTSFLGQGYGIENAAICGVFHHGHAGQLAGKALRRGTIASDIIGKIPESFCQWGIH